MQHYRFYFMVGQRIMNGEDTSCADDDAARAEAERRFEHAEAAFDAIEVWRGTICICRHERVRETRRS
jgi:hypothetical protein